MKFVHGDSENLIYNEIAPTFKRDNELNYNLIKYSCNLKIWLTNLRILIDNLRLWY